MNHGQAYGAGAKRAGPSTEGAAPASASSSTKAGFGVRSSPAPLLASTAEPIRPPTNASPAFSAPARRAALLVTMMFAGRYPGLVTVATNIALRGIFKVQGVAAQENPFVVSTRAPDGRLETDQASSVPRVTVAQPPKAASINVNRPRRSPLTSVHPPQASMAGATSFQWPTPKPSPRPQRVVRIEVAVLTLSMSPIASGGVPSEARKPFSRRMIEPRR